jgi:hypothetical protein
VVDFSSGCAGRKIADPFLKTRPHRLSIRKLTSASLSKGENGAASVSSALFARPDAYEAVLRYKLINVVVVAVVYAVDVL